MLITHKKLQPMQCYHIFSNSMVVYLAKHHYDSYSPQMVPTNPLARGLMGFVGGNLIFSNFRLGVIGDTMYTKHTTTSELACGYGNLNVNCSIISHRGWK